MQFNDAVTVLFMSHTTVAALVGLILDSSITRESDCVGKDSGRNWWDKFKLYGADVRNDEFYALPFGLDRFFPSI